MICSRCGANVPDNTGFCTNCGNAATVSPTPSYAPQGYASQAPQGYAPQSYAPQSYGAPPAVSDYLIWSIITTLCCCLPLGIVGLIFSINCKNDLTAGRYDSAVKNANVAFYCNLIGLIGSLIGWVIYAIVVIAAVAADGGF